MEILAFSWLTNTLTCNRRVTYVYMLTCILEQLGNPSIVIFFWLAFSPKRRSSSANAVCWPCYIIWQYVGYLNPHTKLFIRFIYSERCKLTTDLKRHRLRISAYVQLLQHKNKFVSIERSEDSTSIHVSLSAAFQSTSVIQTWLTPVFASVSCSFINIKAFLFPVRPQKSATRLFFFCFFMLWSFITQKGLDNWCVFY